MTPVTINKITKTFLDGNLKGLNYIEKTFQPFELNKIYSDCVTGNKYQITKIEKVLINL